MIHILNYCGSYGIDHYYIYVASPPIFTQHNIIIPAAGQWSYSVRSPMSNTIHQAIDDIIIYDRLTCTLKPTATGCCYFLMQVLLFHLLFQLLICCQYATGMQCIPLATAYTAYGTLAIYSLVYHHRMHVYMVTVHHNVVLCVPHVKVPVTQLMCSHGTL